MNEPRWVRCIHEAGHAAMACHYGMIIKSATVPMPNGVGSHCEIAYDHSPAEIAAVAASGEVAEELLLGYSSSFGSFDDIGQISDLGQEIGVLDDTVWRETAFVTAREILPARVDMIRTIAEALRGQVTLDHAFFVGLNCEEDPTAL